MGQSASQQNEFDGILNLLLMGKTGHGKSETGNSILNRNVFKASSRMTSVTREVSFGVTTFKDVILKVVDGPGLGDTDIDKDTDKAAAEKNMDKAIVMCSGGVDAFLFVIKFGERFTAEEASVLETLKGIFGENYFDHVIVVMTHGDLFQREMEDNNCGVSFEKWCRQQTGDFSRLFKACSGRVVLINNKEENEVKKQAQIQQIVQLAYDLRIRHGRYTSRCFERAKARLTEFILMEGALILRDDILDAISLLINDIEKLPNQPLTSDREQIQKRVTFLIHEFEAHHLGHGTYSDLREPLKQIDSSLHDVAELQRLANVLKEKIVMAFFILLNRVSFCIFIDDVLSLIEDD